MRKMSRSLEAPKGKFRSDENQRPRNDPRDEGSLLRTIETLSKRISKERSPSKIFTRYFVIKGVITRHVRKIGYDILTSWTTRT